MRVLWASAIPQAMQQHGGISKTAASGHGEIAPERRKAATTPEVAPPKMRPAVKRARKDRQARPAP